MQEPVTIQLTRDEALIMFSFFERFDEKDSSRLRNNAEFIAFMKFAARLEKALQEPFQPNYRELIAEAQARLLQGHEGVEPGAESSKEP